MQSFTDTVARRFRVDEETAVYLRAVAVVDIQFKAVFAGGVELDCDISELLYFFFLSHFITA